MLRMGVTEPLRRAPRPRLSFREPRRKVAWLCLCAREPLYKVAGLCLFVREPLHRAPEVLLLETMPEIGSLTVRRNLDSLPDRRNTGAFFYVAVPNADTQPWAPYVVVP